MLFLEEVNFTSEEITEFKLSLSDKVYHKLNTFPVLIIENIKFLIDLGVKNYKELFMSFSETFLADHSKFKEKFSKYDIEDLLDKLEKNPNIIEYL